MRADKPPALTSDQEPRRFGRWIFPAAISLGFPAVLLCAVAIVVIAAMQLLDRQEAAHRRGMQAARARCLAAALVGTRAEDVTGPAILNDAMRTIGDIDTLRWFAPDGSVRYQWPTGSVSPAAFAEAATAPVRFRDGASAGSLELTMPATDRTASTTGLWAGAALAVGFGMGGFAVLFRAGARRLPAMVTMRRNLDTYSAGLVKRLLDLTLRDATGQATQGWNALARDLSRLQDKLENDPAAGPTNAALQSIERNTLCTMLDRLPLGVMHVGHDRRITFANATASRLLGKSPEALVGSLLTDVLDPEVTQTLLQADLTRTGGVSMDRIGGASDAARFLRFGIPAARGDVHDGQVVVTIQDISGHEDVERSRNDFLYHMTHELRAPLTNIRAYAETLGDDRFDDDQTRRECYNILVLETQRLSRLVEDILGVAQLETGTARLHLGEIDLPHLLGRLVQESRGLADEKRIELTLTVSPEGARVRADEQRLAIAIENLISNAVRYTPEGGRVDVVADVTAGRLTLSVTDTGIGIDTPDQPRVFKKFFRGSNAESAAGGGTGLGLAAAREVARLHGGRIHLQSELGNGTRLVLELPNVEWRSEEANPGH